MIKFQVIDRKTGKPADKNLIAATEDWAKFYPRFDTHFVLSEDGVLEIKDTYGNCARCPEWRFDVQIIQSSAEI